MKSMGAFSEVSPQGQRHGEARRTKGRTERRVQGRVVEKRLQRVQQGRQERGWQGQSLGKRTGDTSAVERVEWSWERYVKLQREESLEYDLLSVEVCSKGCGRNDDWCHVLVKQPKNFERGGRKAQRLRIIENQFEVLVNLDEENVDSEGESTAIPSDNESEISEGTCVVDCRTTTDSRRKRRTPNRKIESGA